MTVVEKYVEGCLLLARSQRMKVIFLNMVKMLFVVWTSFSQCSTRQEWCRNLIYGRECLFIIIFIYLQIANGLVQTTGWPSVVTCIGNWFGKGR